MSDARTMLDERRGAGGDLGVLFDPGQFAEMKNELRDRYRADHQRLLEAALREFFVQRPALRSCEWTIAAGRLGSTSVSARGNGKAVLDELRSFLGEVDHHALAAGRYYVRVACGPNGKITVTDES